MPFQTTNPVVPIPNTGVLAPGTGDPGTGGPGIAFDNGIMGRGLQQIGQGQNTWVKTNAAFGGGGAQAAAPAPAAPNPAAAFGSMPVAGAPVPGQVNPAAQYAQPVNMSSGIGGAQNQNSAAFDEWQREHSAGGWDDFTKGAALQTGQSPWGNPALYQNYYDPRTAATNPFATQFFQQQNTAAQQAMNLGQQGYNYANQRGTAGMDPTTSLLGLQQAQTGAGYLGAGAGAAYGQMGTAGQLAGMAQTPGAAQAAQNGLMRLGLQALDPNRPSVAQAAMQQQAAQGVGQQLGMTAGARGGNAGLAMLAAGRNIGDLQAQNSAQLGVQRLNEDLANRNFAAQAGQAAGNLALQSQAQNAGILGQAGGMYGGASGAFGNLGGQANNMAGQYFNTALNQGQLALQGRNANDAYALGNLNAGYGFYSPAMQLGIAPATQETNNQLINATNLAGAYQNLAESSAAADRAKTAMWTGLAGNVLGGAAGAATGALLTRKP